MRDHLTEFLPWLLVAGVLFIFHLTRDSAPEPLFQTVPLSTPTPVVARPAVAGASAPPALVAVSAAPPATATAACTSSQPGFSGGLAALSARLGVAMGVALECEQAIDQYGNTQQETTTGLAYYRKLLNVACFTTGWDHWGLVSGRLVHWSGPDVDPPN